MAEEWRRRNPGGKNRRTRRSSEFRRLLNEEIEKEAEVTEESSGKIGKEENLAAIDERKSEKKKGSRRAHKAWEN